MIEKIKLLLKTIKNIFFPKKPVFIPLPQDATGKYLEEVNKFIEREFYLALYYMIMHRPIEYTKIYENHYASFLHVFSKTPIDETVKKELNTVMSTFYLRVVTNCLTKMSIMVKESFYRVYSPNSLTVDITTTDEASLTEYIMNFCELKIQMLLTELSLWRKVKQDEDNIDRDTDYWGFDVEEDANDPYFKKWKVLADIEIFLPRVYRYVSVYDNINDVTNEK